MATQGQFQVGYTSGLGYIALAALIFGRWRPSGAVVASIIFGLTVYLSYELVTYQVPISLYFLQMIPYLITSASSPGLSDAFARPRPTASPTCATSRTRPVRRRPVRRLPWRSPRLAGASPWRRAPK